MRKTVILVMLIIAMVSCSSNDNNTQFHTVELQVESDGYFRVRTTYTGNPDAAIDYNAKRLYLETYSKEFSLGEGAEYSYNFSVSPCAGSGTDTCPTTEPQAEYTATILVDGVVVAEQTSTDYANFGDRHITP